MITGIGIDVINLSRIKQMNENIYQKFLTKNEIEEYFKINHHRRKLEFVASRFALKEALFKAKNFNKKFNQITIHYNEFGAPYVNSHDIYTENCNIKLSLTHDAQVAIAIAIIETQ